MTMRSASLERFPQRPSPRQGIPILICSTESVNLAAPFLVLQVTSSDRTNMLTINALSSIILMKFSLRLPRCSVWRYPGYPIGRDKVRPGDMICCGTAHLRI
jgi:hypothetical protein